MEKDPAPFTDWHAVSVSFSLYGARSLCADRTPARHSLHGLLLFGVERLGLGLEQYGDEITEDLWSMVGLHVPKRHFHLESKLG
jgi:hypothetical protein